MLNSMVRSALRVPTVRQFTQLGRRDFTRTFWHMSKPEGLSGLSALSLQKPSIGCSCGCGFQQIHTKGERELVEFLTEEILAEKKAQKASIPNEVNGFKVTFKGAEVELLKKTDKETIKVSFNINHTVDSEKDPDYEAVDEESGMDEMKSKPNFEVDIIKGGKTLSFTCSFLSPIQLNEEEYNDAFGIDEVTIFEGEWTDNNYSVSGNVLDGYFYDLLMNLLEEKGISNEFANKLCNLSTDYDHATYIRLLESMSKFTTDGK